MAREHDPARLKRTAADARNLYIQLQTAKYAHIRTIDRRILVNHLVSAWNYATAPNVLRDDHTHHRCTQLARAIKNRLRRLGFHEAADYTERSDGSLAVTA